MNLRTITCQDMSDLRGAEDRLQSEGCHRVNKQNEKDLLPGEYFVTQCSGTAPDPLAGGEFYTIRCHLQSSNRP